MEKFDWNNWQERRSKHSLVASPYEGWGQEFEKYKTNKSRKIIKFLEMGMDADPFSHLVCRLRVCEYVGEIDYELIFSEYLKCKNIFEWVDFLEVYAENIMESWRENRKVMPV